MIEYVLNGPADNEELNALFGDAWPNHRWTDFGPILESSLIHVLAYESDKAVGFIRVSGCGSVRGFVFGPTVHPDVQRQGVGTALLNEASSAAKEQGVKTLHVEIAPGLRGFYSRAGFEPTAAAVRHLA
jgi:predicted N-acetyltransferase YhbS